MKKNLLFFAALLCTSASSQAQDSTQVQSDQQNNRFKGGWVTLYGGLLVNNSHNLRLELNSPYMFGDNYFSFKNINYGYSAGIGGMYIVDGNLLLGANGNYSGITSQSNTYGEVKLNSYAALVNIGALLCNKNNTLLYSYIGAGYGQYLMTLTNKMDTASVSFDFSDPIENSSSQDFSADYVLFELGLGIKKIIGDKFLIGLDGGLYYSTSTGEQWSKGTEKVKYREAPGMNGGYVRLTLGFGSVTAK